MKAYQINFINHLHQLRGFYWTLSSLVSFPLFFYYFYGSEDVYFGLKASLIFVLVTLVSLSIIHLKYIEIELSHEITIDNEREIIFVKNNNGIDKNITFDDITEINLNISKAKYNGKILFYPWDSYFYHEIISKKGMLVITSLLLEKLPNNKKLVRKTKYISRYFCWPSESGTDHI